MPAPPLNFPLCLYGLFPTLTGKPTLHRAGDGYPGQTSGDYVGYFNAVMRCKTGHGNCDVSVPYNYDWYSVQACADLQIYFQIPVLVALGVVDANVWWWTDYLATH